MKKILSVVIASALMCSLSVPAFAAEYDSSLTQERATASIPTEITDTHNRMTRPLTRSISDEVSVLNEYEVLQEAQEKTETELLEEGYSVEAITNIKSGAASEKIREVTLGRASLSTNQLAGMGYTESEIQSIQTLTGNETIEELAARGVLANCTVYNTFISHTYKASTGKTYFICAFGWEWDKCPAWLLTDCAGCGWNHDFHPDDSVNSNYNVSYKTYVNQNNASDKKYTTKHLYEKSQQTAEDQFDMNGFYGSDYYVKSAYGYMCLSQTGRVNDVKFAFKYGHNEFGPAVSVSYPWGISFGLEGAETIFQPTELVYHDYAVNA